MTNVQGSENFAQETRTKYASLSFFFFFSFFFQPPRQRTQNENIKSGTVDSWIFSWYIQRWTFNACCLECFRIHIKQRSLSWNLIHVCCSVLSVLSIIAASKKLIKKFQVYVNTNLRNRIWFLLFGTTILLRFILLSRCKYLPNPSIISKMT